MMDVLLPVVGVIGTSAAVATAWVRISRMRDARRRERAEETAELRERRRSFYDDAQLGRLDNPRSRAELADAGFDEEEVDFIATWKQHWQRHASGKASDVERWRPVREELEARLHRLLLE